MSDFRLAPGTGIVFSLFRVEPHSPGVCVLTFHASNELGHEFFAAAIVNGRQKIAQALPDKMLAGENVSLVFHFHLGNGAVFGAAYAARMLEDVARDEAVSSICKEMPEITRYCFNKFGQALAFSAPPLAGTPMPNAPTTGRRQ